MSSLSLDNPSDSSDLLTLAHWMAGNFSNAQQARENPQEFAHIHVFFRPLPFDFFGAIGFYSEQSYDYDRWLPYRQGIHRLLDHGDHIYIENYGLTDALRFAGAGHEASLLNPLTHEDLQRRCNCSMVFHRQGDRFIGAVEGNQCLIPKDGILTYLVSEVEVTATTWSSRDRGFDPSTHEPVWGSLHGHLQFTKIQTFAIDLPSTQPTP